MISSNVRKAVEGALGDAEGREHIAFRYVLIDLFLLAKEKGVDIWVEFDAAEEYTKKERQPWQSV